MSHEIQPDTSSNHSDEHGSEDIWNLRDLFNGTTSNNNEITEKDHVTVFVAFNGKWELDDKEWLFKDSKGSIMAVSKYVTLPQITDILCAKFNVDQDSYGLKLEVYYRVGFPIIEIECDEDLSLFISESTKTKLLLCVTTVRKDVVTGGVEEDEIIPDIEEDENNPIVKLLSLFKEESRRLKEESRRRKDHVRVLLACNGKWRWDGEKWLFENSRGFIMDVYKYVTLSQITNIIYEKFNVDQSSYCLKLEVHYRAGSPWFPVTEIQNDQDLLVFISESSKTKLPLCVTRVAKAVVVERAEHGRTDDKAEKRLINAIKEGDLVKAQEIVNTEEVTWTSKLNDVGYTALHFAVGRYRNDEFFREILKGINSQELLTIVDNERSNLAHLAAAYGNTEALKIMLESNPKCLFTFDDNDMLAINYTYANPTIKTFRYLFKQMKSYKDEYDFDFGNTYGTNILYQAIDKGLIDVAYELINDYPSMATLNGNTNALGRIIRKPELFYSGTSYGFYRRFVYNIVPIENNSLGGTNMADLESQTTPKKERSLHDVISRIYVKLWETTLLHVPHVKHLRDDKVKHDTTIKLLRRICEEADRTFTSSDVERLFSYPFCLAVENNTTEAVDVLTTYSEGLYDRAKDGYGADVCELIILNRSEKVYNYTLHHGHDNKNKLSIFKDDDGNNILHLAGRLAPMHKLNAASGAALQMQRELQWFEEVKRVVGITQTRELNKNKETPMMVFRKEHKELRKDGEEWMKKTADSYTITAALIITVVFAAAITVPGGNDSATGKPIYETKASLIIFAISDAISLFTSTTSLLLFLSILTARYADEDFLYKLPKRLIIGLVMLFVSVTSMMIAFSAALYIMFGQDKQWIVIPIAALACLPIASFVTLQFPLLVELISSTYGHGICGKERDYRQSSANSNKKKRA